MGQIKHKSSLETLTKEVACIVPFSSYLLHCDTTQLINIKVVENFNNGEYSAKDLQITVSA